MLVIEGTLGKNQFLWCLRMFRILPYFQNGFPTTIWVKAYLGGTTKNHPPHNHVNVDFILINEKTNFKKQFPIFYNWLLGIVTFDFLSLDVYSQNQCKMFFVFISLHGPCFSTSNLLWNYYKYCKWCFISLMHLTCNEFNVHTWGWTHETSSIHVTTSQKKNHCQIDFLLPPTEGPWTLCVLLYG
jgi:hypothetical protein